MHKRPIRIAKFIVFGALALVIFTFVVMNLWNWLMPTIFSLHAITFWQALGLLVLSKILFGGFRGRHGGARHWTGRGMTPEEREKFKEAMRARCGGRRSAGAEEA
jgi:hypothetical protein